MRIAIGCVAVIAGGALAEPGSSLDLGVIGGPGSFVFDTVGSVKVFPDGGTLDTGLGVWDAGGVLLGQNDDGDGVGPASVLTMSLGSGVYYVGVGGAGSDFADGFRNLLPNGGADPGSLVEIILNIDGLWTGSYFGGFDQLDQETAFFRVEVVPAPGALALVGLGGLAGARRRR